LGFKGLITCDRLDTSAAFLGEQLAEAVGAERLLLARRELFPSEHLVAVHIRTRETLTVPRRILVRYPALVDHLRSTGLHQYSEMS